MSDVRDLEELLDASPNAPPSPPRGNSADLLNRNATTIPGWSPRITAATEMGMGELPSLSLGAASLATGMSLDATSSASSSTSSSASSSASPTLSSSNSAPSSTTTTTPTPPTPSDVGKASKASKQAEKKARAEAFARANPNKGKGAKVKKPKLSKAERRAKQDSQRAAKETQKKGAKNSATATATGFAAGSDSKGSSSSSTAHSNSSDPGTSRSPSASSMSKADSLFSHLPPYQRTTLPTRSNRFSSRENVHPSFAKVGLKVAQGLIVGGNSRCVALLEAVKDVIADYIPPPNSSLSRTLNDHLKPMIHYLVQCRPLSISMGNGIRFVKRLISSTRDLSDEETRTHLIASIDDFIDKRIKLADELIMRNLLGLEPHTTAKIVDGDVVLTHGRSHVVEQAIKYAFSIGIVFRVVVVDSRPRMEGRGLLKALALHGIQCTYVMLGAISYVMKDVTKVILGASAMMANGTALSRVGTAVVAMMGHSQRIPIIFCCETYKFCERVQLDAIVSNEVADPNDLVVKNADPSKDTKSIRKVDPSKDLQHYQSIPALTLLNISYDLTPPEFITVVVTDVGMIPTTSIPVIIREFLNEGMFE